MPPTRCKEAMSAGSSIHNSIKTYPTKFHQVRLMLYVHQFTDFARRVTPRAEASYPTPRVACCWIEHMKFLILHDELKSRSIP